jgi:hypothetical protein
MGNSVYKINKGVNSPVRFRGLKAQYIWYLGGGLAILLVVFSVMYISGINAFICIGFVFIAGGILITRVYKLSNQYGEYGLMKKLASRQIPRVIKSRNRKIFLVWKKNS